MGPQISTGVLECSNQTSCARVVSRAEEGAVLAGGRDRNSNMLWQIQACGKNQLKSRQRAFLLSVITGKKGEHLTVIHECVHCFFFSFHRR